MEAVTDATLERWFSDEFPPPVARGWRRSRDGLLGTAPDAYASCCREGIAELDLREGLARSALPRS